MWFMHLDFECAFSIQVQQVQLIAVLVDLDRNAVVQTLSEQRAHRPCLGNMALFKG